MTNLTNFHYFSIDLDATIVALADAGHLDAVLELHDAKQARRMGYPTVAGFHIHRAWTMATGSSLLAVA